MEDLPHEPIHKLTHPLLRFLKIEAVAGFLLFITTILTIIITNTPWSKAFLDFWQTPIGFHFGTIEVVHPLKHWINDGLMTLFFFIVALELKRELVIGELRNLKIAVLPLAGAIGGMLIPALFYILLMGKKEGAHGWGVVMATDTAFVIACLALLGRRVPSSLRIFLLSLAIFDDIGAIMVVVFGYGSSLIWWKLILGVFCFTLIAGAKKLGIRSVPLYSLIGIVIWFCFDNSGIHPTLVGVILGLMTPTNSWVSDARLRSLLGQVLTYPTGEHWSGDTVERHDLNQAGTAAREALSPLERLEVRLHPLVGVLVMPIFAMANTGVSFSIENLLDDIPLAIIFSLTVGKPLGVISFSWLALRIGLAKPFSRLSWSMLVGGSFLTGIGFTMSLFIANISLTHTQLVAAKIGILVASLISAILGMSILLLLSKRNSN